MKKTKLNYKIQKALNKISKPMLVSVVRTYVDGKLQKEFFGDSLVANFLQIFYSHLAQNDADFVASGAPFSSKTNSINTGGSGVSTQSAIMNAIATTSNDIYGLEIGTGTTTPAPDDEQIEARISDGNGVGEMEYQQMQGIQGVEISGLVSDFTLRREFINSSGGQITPTEVVLVVQNGANYFLIYRDTFTGDDVPNGSTYRVELTFQITT